MTCRVVYFIICKFDGKHINLNRTSIREQDLNFKWKYCAHCHTLTAVTVFYSNIYIIVLNYIN